MLEQVVSDSQTGEKFGQTSYETVCKVRSFEQEVPIVCSRGL